MHPSEWDSEMKAFEKDHASELRRGRIAIVVLGIIMTAMLAAVAVTLLLPPMISLLGLIFAIGAVMAPLISYSAHSKLINQYKEEAEELGKRNEEAHSIIGGADTGPVPAATAKESPLISPEKSQSISIDQSALSTVTVPNEHNPISPKGKKPSK
jgi:hypothetical protein